jgi:predicted DNA-binding transcriptional regulator YafY
MDCQEQRYAEEHMRASRLVNVLLLLQTRGRLTASELSEELEVSVRTIYRDVDALSEAGVPIYAERGPGGGVRLVDGYRTRLTGLTPDEAEALFMSGLPGPAAELGLGTVVSAAQLKVLAALPPELRARASRVTQRFHLDAPGWFRSVDPSPHLQQLADAVWEGRRVEIRYRRAERVQARLIDPLGLVLKGGTWYLVARTNDQLRTFRTSRVESVSPTEERFERPTDFDLSTYWTESTAAYERDMLQVEVEVLIVPESLERLKGMLGETVMRTAKRARRSEPDGRQRLTFHHESIGWAAENLFPLGGDVEVVRPVELRDMLLGTARGILQRYDGDDSRAGHPAGASVPALG